MFKKGFKKIKRLGLEIEPQETFLDTLAQKKERDLGISGRKFEVPLSQIKLKIFYILFLILVISLFGKTVQFQVVMGEEFLASAERNKHGLYFEQSARGVVYDSSMNQIVFNKSSHDLIVKIKDLPETQEQIMELVSKMSVLLSEDLSSLGEKIEETEFNTILVKENLDHETLILLETKINNFPGFEIKKSTIRDYKDGKIFSQLIGFTGKINKAEMEELENYSITDCVGKQGVEESYEEKLRGVPSRILVERDAFNNKISEKVISQPEPGKSLVLWINADLQKKLTEALQSSMDNVGSKKGVAVALDPRTGGVLAMVSLPSFDNNLFSGGISLDDFKKITEDPDEPLFNRSITGGYPVGSSIKPLMASASLQEGIIPPNKDILCEGEVSIPNPYYPDQPSLFLDWKTHGWTDVRKAIAESCNVYFYIIGGGYKDIEGLGVERIKKYLGLFGWGDPTGIDIAGEYSGRVPDPEWKENYFEDYQKKIWRIGDTYHLSIGQGDISITPLQVANAIASIANRGTLYQPHIVKEIVNSSGSLEVIEKIEPRIIRQGFIDSDNLEIVREGMREGVIYGSSVALNKLPVEAASKTGTAQTHLDDIYYNWVSVFAPYENPEIVLTVIIEDVEGMQFAALPVARDTLNWYFQE